MCEQVGPDNAYYDTLLGTATHRFGALVPIISNVYMLHWPINPRAVMHFTFRSENSRICPHRRGDGGDDVAEKARKDSRRSVSAISACDRCKRRSPPARRST